MAISLITDHVQRALDQMLSQFRDSTNLRKLVSILAGEVQELETVTFDVVDKRMLDTAVGVQLDQYGKILGVARNGLSDDVYREVLRVRIRANLSSGTIPPSIDVVETMLADHLTQSVSYTPLWPACYAVGWVLDDPTGDVSTELLDALVDIMLDMRPAGVCLELIQGVSPAPEGGYFGFDHDPNALGFDDTGGMGGFLNGRKLWPLPLTFPFPTDSQGGVWATTDLKEFSTNLGNLDGLEVTTWNQIEDAVNSDALTPHSGEDGPDYDRDAGHVERGALAFSGTSALVVPGVAFFPDTGLFSAHFRVRATGGGSAWYLLASKDPADDSEDAAIGWDPVVGWFYEEAGTIVVSQGSPSTDWHTVTVIGDGSDWFLYVDRLQVDTASVSVLPGGNESVLGARSNTNGSYDGPAFDDYAQCELAVWAMYQAAQSDQDRDDTWDAIDECDGVIVAAASIVDELGNTLVDEFGNPIVTE